MRTILLTGGSGFIGSYVLSVLCKFYPDYNIVNCDARTYAARAPLYIQKPANLIEEVADIRDQLAVHKLYTKYKPTITIHMAAESHVCRSIAGPRDFATTNLMGTFNLLEAHVAAGGGRFLHVSTDEVFGEIRQGSFTENSPLRPRSPYAATKAGSDMLVKCYQETYGLDAVIVNMSNNFGPNQHEEKLVPRTILHILQGKPVVLFGKGNHVRDWLWVGDAAAGILAALQNGQAGHRYCLGGEHELTNKQMVLQIFEAIKTVQPADNVKLKLEYTNARPTDDFRYSLDVTKAKQDLGWEPSPEQFQENLCMTTRWYARVMLGNGGATSHGRGA